MPPGVNVILLGDPETIVVFVGICIIWIVGVEVAVIVEYIGVFGILVVRRRDCVFIHHDRTVVEDLCAGFVAEPALEDEAVQATGRCADLVAVADTEAHCLIRITPVDIAGAAFRIIRMQEDTVLDLPPLGVDGYAALRHRVKIIELVAGFVHKPALEDEAFRNIARYKIVVVGDVGTVSDAVNSLDLTLTGIDNMAVAVYVSAVHEVDRILDGHVVVPHVIRVRAGFGLVSIVGVAIIGRRMLIYAAIIGRPEPYRRARFRRVDHIVPVSDSEVDVVNPVVIGIRIARGQAVAVFIGQVAEHLFVHNADGSLDGISIIQPGFCGRHQDPADEFGAASDVVIFRPGRDRLSVIPGDGVVVIRIATHSIISVRSRPVDFCYIVKPGTPVAVILAVASILGGTIISVPIIYHRNVHLQRILYAVEVDVHDGATVHGDLGIDDLLIAQREAGERIRGRSVGHGYHTAVLGAAHGHIPQVACCAYRERVDNAVANGSCADIGCREVVAAAVQILLPDQDGIAGGIVWNPLGVDGGEVIYRIPELEFIAICAFSVFVPAAEGIAEAGHFGVITRFLSHVFGLEEAGGVILGALAVFIEDQPVTFGSVDAELDVAGDTDVFVVLIGLSLYIVNDVGAAFGDQPALEVELVALDVIGHIDGITVGGGIIVRAEDHALLAQRNIMLVVIGDLIGLEQHGVIGDGIVDWLHAAFPVQDFINLDSDVRDCHGRGSPGGILRVGRPATEEHVVIKIARARIVDDLLHVVVFFDVHGSDLAIQTDEFDRQGIVDHSVDRESAGFEFGHVAIDLGFHLFDVAIVAHVSDSSGLADSVGGESHLDRSQRLDFLAVRVDKGDVYGGHVLGSSPNALRDLFQHYGIIYRS